jgi:hypothetical protein
LTDEAAQESPVPATAADIGDPSIRVLGPVEVHGWVVEPDRRVLEELLCFLVFHDTRPMSADQIQLALRPSNGSLPEVSRKTFHTYLSGLRRSVGADHLPDANADGYQVLGVDSDWTRFQELLQEADRTEGEESIGHLRAALGLVRGVPFEGVTTGQYEWVFNEQLASDMTGVIATVAVRLANELFARQDYRGVDQAVRAGLKAVPDDADLWRIGRRPVAKGEGTEQRLGPAALLAHRLVGLAHRGCHLGQGALGDPGVVDEPGLTKGQDAPRQGLVEQVRGVVRVVFVEQVDIVQRDELGLASPAQSLRAADLGPDGVDHGLWLHQSSRAGRPDDGPGDGQHGGFRLLSVA